MDTAELDEEFIGDLLELDHVLREQWQLDMHRGSQGSSEVSWAGGDVTEMVVVGELGELLDRSSCTGESIEDSSDVGAWLHGDDSELILLVYPHKESLFVVVEDSSARWPVAVEATSYEEAITLPREIKLVKYARFEIILACLLQKEMVGIELVLVLLGHAFEWVEFSGEVTLEALTSLDDEVHDKISLLLVDTWSKRESLEVTLNTDSCAYNHSSLVFWKRWNLES